MVMLGIYATGKAPFRTVFLHGLVRDKDRQKMSKSKGNVIDPLGVIDLYGADALRVALVFATSPGQDVVLSEDKIIAQKRFANKIWNAARFVLANKPARIATNLEHELTRMKTLTSPDKKILKDLDATVKAVTKNIENFQFHEAAQKIYHFFWHNFCDVYIEKSKKQIEQGSVKEKERTVAVLLYVLAQSLKLLHPFMPFVTERIYQMLPNKAGKPLIIEQWPGGLK
jgi:valyl-tRNA synthetase